MTPRHELDRLALRITGQDIRLVGFWTPLPGLPEYAAEYARELGVSQAALLRCQDIVEVLDLASDGRSTRQQDQGHPLLF